MERFVFVTAIIVAVIFGLGAMFGGPHFSFNFDDEDGDFRGVAAIVEVAPGRMEAAAFTGDRLRIRNIAANVVIIAEDRTDFLIEIDNAVGKTPMPAVTADSDRVVIDGQLRGRVRRCDGGGADLRGYGSVTAEELPRITIRAPRDLDVAFGGAGTTEIGPTESLEVEVNGCGAVNAGDVAGALDAELSGSGEIRVGAARSADLNVNGSGEIRVAAVAEGADVEVNGSGSVTIASLNGDLDMENSGSGSLSVLAGSVASATVELRGSGAARIAAPVQTLDVQIFGSGDVDVEGVVGEVNAAIYGSGDVDLQFVTGSVRKSIHGSGDVRISGGQTGSESPANAP